MFETFDKWFVLGGKIVEQVTSLEETKAQKEIIVAYLKKAKKMRAKFLKSPVTPIEQIYTPQVEKLFKKYNV